MNYTPFQQFDASLVSFAFGPDRNGKPTIVAHYGPNGSDVAMVTPACVTHWPRVTGDGNFGTMWGPASLDKAKYTLDLTDSTVNDQPNSYWKALHDSLEAVDDILLAFVHANQLKILGRKNLSMEEVKMLQIRSVRPKYDKVTGHLTGHSMQLSAAKFKNDMMGGRYERAINVCDSLGSVVPGAMVCPGDVVAATAFINQCYTGVGGDKFGIHWSFEDVQVVCQRGQLSQKTDVPAFTSMAYEFAAPYEMAKCGTQQMTAQFPEDMVTQVA